jgi:hypothetical protein
MILALAGSACAQGVVARAPARLATVGEAEVETSLADADAGESADAPAIKIDSSILDRLLSVLSQEDDPDGSIDTDRPTFTPAHTVVPVGRLQFESGFTFDHLRTDAGRTTACDIPELAMRLGLAKRVEFRTFWFGQTWAQSQPPSGGRTTQSNGPSDMEIGFKWQLIERRKDRLWIIPTTALITSIFAPTGGTSPYSSETVDPYINLIYGWKPTEKLTLCGSIGYLGRRDHFATRRGRRSDAFERYHQSLAAFYSVAPRTTLFYEWYILMPAESIRNDALNYMDGGVLYQPTPNTQIDLRAGFGLNAHAGELFTGAGFSVRF